jgi:hypothetical protein
MKEKQQWNQNRIERKFGFVFLKENETILLFLSHSPIPPPLPDFYIVEDGLNYTKKGEKKHFTVQNRYGQFKMVKYSIKKTTK